MSRNNDGTTEQEREDTKKQRKKESDAYFIYKNPEKKALVRMGEERYMPNATSRILLSGLPGVGKRNLILNIIDRMDPPPSCVHLVHIDPLTTEYDHVAARVPVLMYSPEDFPTISNIENPFESSDNENDAGEDSEEKKETLGPLVIVDEITTDQLGKEGAARFERLVNYGCTHRDTTLICSIQSLLNLPPKVRRAFNCFALWKQNDEQLNKIVSNRCGIHMDFLESLFQLCQSKYDFIFIDTDEERESEWRYRLNWMYPIIYSENTEGGA